MARYKVVFETEGPANQYFNRLMDLGHRHCCALCPEIEFSDKNASDYNVIGSDIEARKQGETLVSDLQRLEFIVQAFLLDHEKLVIN